MDRKRRGRSKKNRNNYMNEKVLARNHNYEGLWGQRKIEVEYVSGNTFRL